MITSQCPIFISRFDRPQRNKFYQVAARIKLLDDAYQHEHYQLNNHAKLIGFGTDTRIRFELDIQLISQGAILKVSLYNSHIRCLDE